MSASTTPLQARGRLLHAEAILRVCGPLISLNSDYQDLAEAIASHANEEFTPADLALKIYEIMRELTDAETADCMAIPVDILCGLLMQCINVETEEANPSLPFERQLSFAIYQLFIL